MEREVYEFISRQTNDPIVEWKTCTVSGQKFPIYQSDLNFYSKISPVFAGKKYKIPTPTLCPEERQRKRLAFRNERKLYKRICDATGKQMISMYSEESPYKIYEQKYWWSDAWDPLDYGVDFDFSRRFNEQFLELLLQVPSFNLLNINSINSEYANHVLGLENCYMCFSSLESRGCVNTRGALGSNECYDSCFIESSELCYDCISCSSCYKLFHSRECINCSNSIYLQNCLGCEFCFNCNNLQNKKYCINNVQYTKQDYEKSLLAAKAEIIPIIKLGQNQQNCHNSYGNNLINCSNCIFVSELSDSEYAKYTFDDGSQKYCYDCYGGSKSEYCLELMSCAHSYETMFVCYGNNNTNVLYSNKIYNCKDCFACVGLRHQQYCIFNKQYNKAEYEMLVSKIIEHMQQTTERGEFFDPMLSPFAYNETVAENYYTLTKEAALKMGYRLSSYEAPFPKVEGIIKCEDLSSDIKKLDDTILSKAIACETTGRPFRIIKQELDFYRNNNLSLPRRHPDVRHQERLTKRPATVLHLAECVICKNSFLSAYESGYQGEVYCETCYNKEK